ncbi:MAG TPA: non-heme iron oxygenase ferredoxin subunit [Thermomicrobiales bacterium]|nr:non-heme iron oxygenase ferredoxin subunit [Thermomicrobiales bacterium]
MTDDGFETVAQVGDIGPGELLYVEVGGAPVCLIDLDGELYALGDICTHEGASLADGQIIGDELECPLHGGMYDIRTGKPTGPPVIEGAKTYRVRVVGDEIQAAPAE